MSQYNIIMSAEIFHFTSGQFYDLLRYTKKKFTTSIIIEQVYYCFYNLKRNNSFQKDKKINPPPTKMTFCSVFRKHFRTFGSLWTKKKK